MTLRYDFDQVICEDVENKPIVKQEQKRNIVLSCTTIVKCT